MKRFILACCLFATACGSSPAAPSAPAVMQVAGTWSGSITSNQVAGSGPARITITQNGTAINGTWNAVGPGGPGAGNMAGTVSGQGLAMTLESSVPGDCPYTVNATVSGASMTGTYATFSCTVAASGGINLTRQ